MYIVYAPMNIPDIWRFMVNGHFSTYDNHIFITVVQKIPKKFTHKILKELLKVEMEGVDGTGSK